MENSEQKSAVQLTNTGYLANRFPESKNIYIIYIWWIGAKHQFSLLPLFAKYPVPKTFDFNLFSLWWCRCYMSIWWPSTATLGRIFRGWSGSVSARYANMFDFPKPDSSPSFFKYKQLPYQPRTMPAKWSDQWLWATWVASEANARRLNQHLLKRNGDMYQMLNAISKNTLVDWGCRCRCPSGNWNTSYLTKVPYTLSTSTPQTGWPCWWTNFLPW